MTASLAVLIHSGSSQSEDATSTFIDGIHSESVTVECFQIDQVKQQLDILDEYDGLVFGAMGNTEAAYSEMKKFTEAAQEKSQLGSWRNKIATAFFEAKNLTLDDLSALIQYSMFSAQHNMVWVSAEIKPENVNGVSSLATADLSLTHATDLQDLENLPQQAQAFIFGKRVAQVTKSWCLGH